MKKIFILILLLSSIIISAPKVVIVGFDGVDYNYTESYLKEGYLPNLKKLMEEGDFKPLLPPVPAQTPVSWSTFTTGLEPGQHMIFDFLKRDPNTYMPSFAVAEEGRKKILFGKNNFIFLPIIIGIVFFFLFFLIFSLIRLRVRFIISVIFSLILVFLSGFIIKKYLPLEIPTVKCNQQGIPFWKVLADKGIKSYVMRIPVTFPANPFKDGHLLAGLGVPDLSLRIGKPFYFTSDLFLPSEKNEFSVEIVELPDNKGEMEVEIVGPPNKLFKEPQYIKIPLKIKVAEDKKSITLEVCGQRFTLKEKEWSDWIEFVFPYNPLIKVKGVSKFYVLSIEPEVRFYLSPINFDPRNLPIGFDVTYPPSWAKELAKKFGIFRTIGWGVDTWSVSEELTDDDFFMKEWHIEPNTFSPIFESILNEDNELVVLYYEFTDRVGHIFFRLMDKEHPYYKEELAKKFGNALRESYVLMDEIVGKIREKLPKDTIFIVLSDHGFSTWRYAVNYNTWLVQEGFMKLTGAEGKTQDLYALFDQGQFWPNVDWSQTKAYCMGLGGLYINLKGRESKGIVSPGEEHENVRKELINKLENWIDPSTGLHPVAKVYTREEAYNSFDPVLIPDLIVTNSPFYRISWQTSLGGIPSQTIEPNAQVWSGDHCSLYPPAVPGIIFSNKKIEKQMPYIKDIYPTILKHFKVEAPYKLDGEALF